MCVCGVCVCVRVCVCVCACVCVCVSNIVQFIQSTCLWAAHAVKGAGHTAILGELVLLRVQANKCTNLL